MEDQDLTLEIEKPVAPKQDDAPEPLPETHGDQDTPLPPKRKYTRRAKPELNSQFSVGNVVVHCDTSQETKRRGRKPKSIAAPKAEKTEMPTNEFPYLGEDLVRIVKEKTKLVSNYYAQSFAWSKDQLTTVLESDQTPRMVIDSLASSPKINREHWLEFVAEGKCPVSARVALAKNSVFAEQELRSLFWTEQSKNVLKSILSRADITLREDAKEHWQKALKAAESRNESQRKIRSSKKA